MAVKGKQEKYESFLASVQDRETKVIIDSIPKLKRQMTECIRFFNEIDFVSTHKNWQEKTLPRLRGYWKAICEIEKQCKQSTIVPDNYENAQKILKLFGEVRFDLSGWTRYKTTQHVVILSQKRINDSHKKNDRNAVRISQIDLMVVIYDTDENGIFIRNEEGELSFRRIV